MTLSRCLLDTGPVVIRSISIAVVRVLFPSSAQRQRSPAAAHDCTGGCLVQRVLDGRINLSSAPVSKEADARAQEDLPSPVFRSAPVASSPALFVLARLASNYYGVENGVFSKAKIESTTIPATSATPDRKVDHLVTFPHAFAPRSNRPASGAHESVRLSTSARRWSSSFMRHECTRLLEY